MNEHPDAERFKVLPAIVALDSTITVHEAEPAPGARLDADDTRENAWLLRTAGL